MQVGVDDCADETGERLPRIAVAGQGLLRYRDEPVQAVLAQGPQQFLLARVPPVQRVWDIAVATGQPSPLSAELAGQLMPVATAIVEDLRGFAYAPALDPRPGDGSAAALLRYLGRDPGWAR